MLMNMGGREEVWLSVCECTCGYVCMGSRMFVNVCVRECILLKVWVFVNELVKQCDS